MAIGVFDSGIGGLTVLHALVRQPASLAEQENSRVFRGDATNPGDVARASEGTDIIISVVGPGSRVAGTLNFERKVSLYVSDQATIGPVQGATAARLNRRRRRPGSLSLRHRTPAPAPRARPLLDPTLGLHPTARALVRHRGTVAEAYMPYVHS